MSESYLWRISVPAHQATPMQRRLAQEHADRMRRWHPAPPTAPPPEPQPEPPPVVQRPPPPIEAALKLTINRPGVLSARLITEIVAAHFDMSRLQLLSRQRRSYIVRPRQIAIYLSLEMLHDASLSEVARWFGGFDHTTMLHARHRIAELIRDDPRVAYEVDQLRQTIIDTSRCDEAANDNISV